MNNCRICGEPTTGSISAAGNTWTTICQTCRDFEDATAKANAKALAQGFKFILGSLGLGELGSEVHASQIPADAPGDQETLPAKEKLKQFN